MVLNEHGHEFVVHISEDSIIMLVLEVDIGASIPRRRNQNKIKPQKFNL